MFTIPDTPPNITCVDFAVVRADAKRPVTQRFLYDPEENVTGISLNDATTEFNRYLQSVVVDGTVTSGRVSISFDHGVRPVLALPIKGTCPDLNNIGDLVGMVSSMMQESGEFPETAENNVIYHLAALTGRSVDTPEAPSQRP